MIHETRALLAEYNAVESNGKNRLAIVPPVLACETFVTLVTKYPSFGHVCVQALH